MKKIKKTIQFWAILLLCATNSLLGHSAQVLPANDAEFIYIVAYPGNQNNSTKSYVSGIIEYSGYDACSNNGNSLSNEQFFSEAGHKFLKYLENEYGLNQNEWKVQYKSQLSFSDYPSGYFKGYETKSEAQGELETYLRNNDHIQRTSFTYKCLSNGTIHKAVSQQNNAAGKAYWCTYYIKNDNAVYITNVYNNDCNHCQNEIAM